MSRFAPLLIGIAFGYSLQRAGATDYDNIANMFLLEDLHLAGVMGVAMLFIGVSLGWIRRQRTGPWARWAAAIQPKPMKPGLVIGALIFGAGWAITGTCPGTGLAQLGEGKLVALATIAGMLVGTFVYMRFGAALESRLQRRR